MQSIHNFKGEPGILYEKALNEHKRLTDELLFIRKELQSLPTGKIICSYCNGHSKWYHSDGHNKTYIPKHKRDFAEQLAKKKYLSQLEDDYLHEITAIDYYLRHHKKSTGSSAEKILSENKAYFELLKPYFTPLSHELAEWVNSPFSGNPNHPETLTHKTILNTYVRSKSESMIYYFLYTNRIPFRYEAPLNLNKITLYPDFTIRHPISGDYYYWEHFGMMDDAEYIQKAFSKLSLYTENNIIPGIQLITTYETKEYPLSIQLIENTIQQYFL